MRVFFNEYNPWLNQTAYLPLVSGKLRAYAETSETVRRHYDFQPFLFHIDRPQAILEQYDRPAVAAFSSSIWNEQLCLHVAREVKRQWPDCLIIFGGTQVPHHSLAFLGEHSFIDVCVRAEGEEPFKRILEQHIHGRDLSGIANVTWRGPDGALVENLEPAEFARDLDVYPSPYVEGLFDPIIEAHSDTRFQAIIETNRGCPFHCTFCYWGKGGLSRKYRYSSIERVRAEMEWIGRNRVAFVYNADSNFGMNRRDEDIAGIFVDIRQRFGFPEKVVNLYGKNTDERIFSIAKLLYDNGMHKGVGLSRQSMNGDVLENIKRDNIKMSVYASLQSKFEEIGIPVFCELILGLPGETYDSFADGMSELLEISLHSQLVIVVCEVYPNTEMGDPDYQRKHGIVTKRNTAYGVHSVARDPEWVDEHIDYIVATNSMPPADWRRAGALAWATMSLTGLRLGYYILQYLHDVFGCRHMDFIRFVAESCGRVVPGGFWQREIGHYDAYMGRIADGEGRAVLVPGFGDIYWSIEEATFLRAIDAADDFYAEMEAMVTAFLTARNIPVDGPQLAEVVLYQKLRMPTPKPRSAGPYPFSLGVPGFFADPTAGLTARPQWVSLDVADFDVERQRFAVERLLWARRGGKFEVQIQWGDAAPPRPARADSV